ncbi:hypothetical protein R3W88_024534 [Solanum pinnatisectum]|uniref:Uncharacterized protein n=1 Tax=Solanum pinnatisectum TaxID=50273 RepID=A0AAV9K1X4_9SOLN|nr:hypothetical protein R3W88_034187 [Solanum pinnatisectum]KAK4731546.1 hypothetical protein R3W88_024534 [Solanum pinnatisectum]
MSNKSNRNNLNSEKVHAYKKARRRELYKLTQSNKKDAFLARTRANSATESNASIGASSSTTTLPTVQCNVILLWQWCCAAYFTSSANNLEKSIFRKY